METMLARQAMWNCPLCNESPKQPKTPVAWIFAGGGRMSLTTGEKIVLVLSGTFAVVPLMLLMFLPQNSLFTMPLALEILLYVAIGTFFLLFIKFRQELKLSLVFMWVLCGFFILSIVLFTLASWTKI